MSKSVSPTALGAFVIGAIILIVASVLIFSSGNIFSQNYIAVAVFPGNVKGLVVGSPVEMRGVKIGSVKRIEILFDEKLKSITVPVYLEIDPSALTEEPYTKQALKTESNEEWKRELKSLINAGLKAELSLKSLVTGQMIVDVDFYPDTPVKMTQIDSRFPEIPTRETMTDRVINTLQKLPLEQLLSKAIILIDDMDKLVTSQNLTDTLLSIKQTSQTAHQLLANMDSQIKPLSSSIKSTLSDISSLTTNANKQIGSLSQSAKLAMLEAKRAMSSIDDLVNKDSVTRVDLDNTLKELAKAAKSIRMLTDYIERHPEALIKGKGY